MIIAVNTRLRKEEQPAGYEIFMFEILDRLSKNFPEHEFLYIFDKPYDENRIFNKNVLPVIAGPETSNSLRLQYWFNYKIPAVLRKHKADAFLSMDGICSQRTRKPQCLLINDLSFLLCPEVLKKTQARFLKKFTPSFLAKAKAIATISGFSRSAIAAEYHINAEDIDIIRSGINEQFKPIGWEEKEIIRAKYADGKAYFLYSGDINKHSNLVNLLKAFTFFKKRQKSNMILLIAGKADEQFIKDLKTYKLKDEVKLLENLSTGELAKITAAAYTMVYPVLYDDLALPPLQAIQSGIPVITSNAGALPFICGDAALFVTPGDFAAIAEKMMLVFKNEDKAMAMVKAGKSILQQHQWDKSASLLMQSILKAFNS